MRCIVAYLVLGLAAALPRKINYCGSRMCGNTNSHTLCQYRNGPGPLCKGYINARLTSHEKARILARLNRRRNQAASGWLKGMPPAGNMLKLRWVEELAREAQLWADQCHPPSTREEHDSCRDLYSMTVGQCVASVVGEAPGLHVESMVDMWYMQNMLYKGNVTIYYPPETDRNFYGDFAQMVWHRSFLVGCGRSRFMALSFGRLRSVERLVCNFAPSGPVPYRLLWSPTEPASACPMRARPDKQLTSLCDYQPDLDESHDIDNSMTLEEHLLLNAVIELEKNLEMDEEGTLDKLYLTNLAVVTMENPMTTVSYNSVQKRDIVEAIDPENDLNNNKYLTFTISLFDYDVNTKSKLTKKKASVIGRPKSYNIEDLNDFDDRKEESTNKEINEKVKRDEMLIYGDYNSIETQDENKTMIITETTTSVAANFTNYPEVAFTDGPSTIQVNTTEIREPKHITIQMNNFTDVEISPYNTNTTNFIIINETLVAAVDNGKSVEDYLSDPETVKQLQDALDRMEVQASATSSTSGKVRREINKYPPEQTTLSPEDERNRTLARGPMLNMVLKYMPYLKQYEHDLLGASSGNSLHTSNSLSRFTRDSINAAFGSVCAFFGSVCATFGSVCATFGSVCEAFGSISATFGSLCPLFSSMYIYFDSVCRLFGSLCYFGPLMASYLLLA